MPLPPPQPTDPSGFLGPAETVDRAGPGALLLRARYDETRFSPALFATHGIDRPPSLAAARDRRLAEFLAGRMLAARGMAALGLPPQPVAIAADRRPVFPHGLTGSISHARGLVACLVTRDADPGVDIEARLSGDALTAVRDTVLTANERTILQGADPMLVTAVFSAKETLFKALFPTVGRIFGFECAVLTGLPREEELTLRLTKSLAESLPSGICLDIALSFAADYVVSWLIHRPGHKPRLA